MITRFAPSPTGPLHLGHAFSAILAHDIAVERGGRFLLRIEDIDRKRSKPQWEQAIYDDLEWLGLTWETPVMRQSERLDVYQVALRSLWRKGLLFACHCNRRDILEAATAPQEGSPNLGPDGIVYPGTCRGQDAKALGPVPPLDSALRLDMRAVARDLTFVESGDGTDREITISADHLLDRIGDVVLARRDFGTSYHLSVTLDDAAQDITLVTRGRDLFDATPIHVLLQGLFEFPTPVYHHHRLIRDESGKRLAKRDDARAISKYRSEGRTPDDIRRMVGL